MVVKIYTSSTCAYCHQVKEFFKEKGIKYVEANISENKEDRMELMKMGYRSVPVTVIDGEVVVGYKADELGRLVDGYRG